MGEGIGYYIDHGRLVPLCLVKKRYKTKQLLKVAALMTWQNTAQRGTQHLGIFTVFQSLELKVTKSYCGLRR